MKENVKTENYSEELVSEAEDNTVVVTSAKEKIEALTDRKLLAALESHDPSNKNYSAYFLDNSISDTITPSKIKELASGIHSNVESVQEANMIIRNLIVTNDIVGKTYESLESNVNTGYKVSYKTFPDKKGKQRTLEKVKAVIDDFNQQIDLEQLIRTSVSLTYAEGNRLLCLRHNDGAYSVDSYPLGVAEIAPYTYGGNPVILINIKELENRLKKTYQKTRRGGSLLFKDIDEDIKVNFPSEVYDAYKSRETYVRLDTKYTGVMRVGNMGRQYGVSPIFRAINSILAFENLENAEYVNNQAKAKKIIHQILRKEPLGRDGDRKGHEIMAAAHDGLMQAWRNKTVVYTSAPYVEKIVYVEPEVENVSAEQKSSYISQIMASLGIGWNDINSSNFSVSNISLDQLMKRINSISEQLGKIVQRWYRIVLENNGFDMEFLPSVRVMDSEQLSFDMKKDLVDTLYNKLNCSRRTAYETLGFTLEDEMQRRLAENEGNLDDIFYARENAYTKSSNIDGDNKGGRPPDSDDEGKQVYDENYTENNR